MEKIVELVGILVVAMIVFIGIDFILAIPTMYLWNWLMPKIFGLCKIGYWQAFGLSLLAGLIFGKINCNTKSDN